DGEGSGTDCIEDGAVTGGDAVVSADD
ncbi:hypothetical protein AVEN_175371-1, partial [Araneus ventricosus]